ncbi:MAG: hypothetical protein HKP39_09970 [Eudoraea sp.]|nr:hypothetical protein [Eudoraea sp.]NNL02588.1 hypothetical protein [Eudoraea sp.]
MKIFPFLTVVLGLIVATAHSQNKSIDLGEKYKSNSFITVNRELSQLPDDSRAVGLNAIPGDGLSYLKDISFKKGTVSIELLGENNPGRSFVGFAFNIQNDSTYEVVYFRPFNFVAKEKIRKAHMVQYIYHPEYTWKKLRETRTGEFENEIVNPPDPDQWFKAKIEIGKNTVKVYVEDSENAVLEIERLTEIKSDKIGIWTGFNSSGSFRNLHLETR